MKKFLKKILGENLLSIYHKIVANLAAAFYGYPGKKMFVVGVTGTKGKTSTANFIWSVLTAAGFKTGLLGTANIRIDSKERMNEFHMTMPPPFSLQKLLKQMVNASCTHLVMEATSEGMRLWRHLGIDFNTAVFTNLTPEHLPSHGGSFENYKQAKTRLFAALKKKNSIIIANADDPNCEFYLKFPADVKKTFGLDARADFQATQIKETTAGVTFVVNQDLFYLSVLGRFNVYNALPAIALGNILNIPKAAIQKGLSGLKLIPGRMQKIDAGQKFTVVVDYAHEKVSMNALLDTARKLAGENKVIVLLGAEGGGRDKSKRPAMGEAAAKKADFVICSNVDPYEDDPKEIVEDIALAAEHFGKVKNKDLFVIEDRREGIRKALSLAKPGDIVAITGKGAEQSMIIGGRLMPWDDRVVVAEELSKIV